MSVDFASPPTSQTRTVRSPAPHQQSFRSIFISDTHLGSRHCQANLLKDFLKAHDSQTLYLVGDIIDGWRLRKSWYWPQQHADVLNVIFERARLGADVFYIPGNHDDFSAKFAGKRLRNIEVVDHIIHECADGRRYLVSTPE